MMVGREQNKIRQICLGGYLRWVFAHITDRFWTARVEGDDF